MTYDNSLTPPGSLQREETKGDEYRYATFQRRLGALALDSLIYVFTLGIGWTIWAFIVRGKGQTPGKKILKLRVLNFETGAVATRWHMTIREFFVPHAVGIASVLTAGLAGIAWGITETFYYFTKNKRTFRDHWVKTVVISEA
jgi:uncharacterized RDD family membrane protein YckC